MQSCEERVKTRGQACHQRPVVHRCPQQEKRKNGSSSCWMMQRRLITDQLVLVKNKKQHKLPKNLFTEIMVENLPNIGKHLTVSPNCSDKKSIQNPKQLQFKKKLPTTHYSQYPKSPTQRQNLSFFYQIFMVHYIYTQ